MSATLSEERYAESKKILLEELDAARERGIEIAPTNEQFVEALDKVHELVQNGFHIDTGVWVVVLGGYSETLSLSSKIDKMARKLN